MTQRLEHGDERLKDIFNRIKTYHFKVEFDVYFNNEARYLSHDFYKDNWQENWKTIKYPFVDDINLIYECNRDSTKNNLHREMAKEILYQRKRMYDYMVDITKRFEKLRNMFGINILELDDKKFIDLLRTFPVRPINSEEFSGQTTQFELINELIGFNNYCTIAWGKVVNSSRCTIKDIKDKFAIKTLNGRRYFNFNIEYFRLIFWNIFFESLTIIFMIYINNNVYLLLLAGLLTGIFLLFFIPLGSLGLLDNLHKMNVKGILEKMLFFFGFLPYNFIKEDVHNPLEVMYGCNVDLLRNNKNYIQIEYKNKVK